MSNPHHGQLLSMMFFPTEIAPAQLETYLQYRKVQLNMRTMKGAVTKKIVEIQLQILTAVEL